MQGLLAARSNCVKHGFAAVRPSLQSVVVPCTSRARGCPLLEAQLVMDGCPVLCACVCVLQQVKTMLLPANMSGAEKREKM